VSSRTKATLSRREFLEIGAVGVAGLVIGCRVGSEEYSRAGGELAAWIHIGTDGIVTIHVSESEMGQGVMTAFAMILADEMEADWSKIRAVHAAADRRRFGRQSTGGSTSIRLGYTSLREAGAAAREMLVAAAAAEWAVPARECVAREGTVLHEPSGRSATYGHLAERASALPQPRRPRRKQPSEFRFMGRAVKRLDSPPKVDGSAVFGLDVIVPDMLVAVMAHSPVFGGLVKSYDATRARAVRGARDVVQVPTGVAVVADGLWAALAGRRALEVEWDDRNWGATSSDDIWAMLRDLCPKGVEAESRGNPDKALSGAAQRVEAVYRAPYLAHATMEPMNCVADVRPGACEIWVGTQAQTRCQDVAAEITGLTPGQVTVNTMYLGGGFGRRANAEVVAEAVHVSKAVGRPVKVVYTREDDMRRGWYRPAAYNELAGALDEEGWPIAWVHRIAGDGGVDGAADMPYEFRNFRVTHAPADLPVTTWQWRAVDNTQNAYVVECFLDELARAGGKDPLALRLRLLGGRPRHQRVLETAAERAGWNTPLPAGRARGIALSACFGSIVAQVAEVSLGDDGRPVVHRVVCAIDCGVFINPDTIRAQMDSGIIFGLSAALYGEIGIKDGGAVQGNYHDYRIVRMNETPVIETHIVESGEAPGGIGELGTPPIVPAVCNALHALTGEAVRDLPILKRDARA
jgi:isoquinoline 1-oxidoreductase beta subunit